MSKVTRTITLNKVSYITESGEKKECEVVGNRRITDRTLKAMTGDGVKVLAIMPESRTYEMSETQFIASATLVGGETNEG